MGEWLDGHRLERVVGGNILEDLGRGERGSVLNHDPVNNVVPGRQGWVRIHLVVTQ